MMAGLQGAGKTTNCAKLAALLRKQQQRRPLLVACDVYRPAAIEQLKVVGKQLNITVFDEGQGDPVEIAKHGIDFARKNGYDLVFLDTAGRPAHRRKADGRAEKHQGHGKADRDHPCR